MNPFALAALGVAAVLYSIYLWRSYQPSALVDTEVLAGNSPTPDGNRAQAKRIHAPHSPTTLTQPQHTVRKPSPRSTLVVGAASAALTLATPLLAPQTVLLPTAMVIAAFACTLTAIDWRWLKLPNALTQPLLVITLTNCVLAIHFSGSAGNQSARRAAVALLGSAIVALALTALGMGAGDMRLIPSLAATTAAVSWSVMAVSFMLAVTGALVVTLIHRRRVAGRVTIAFGPFLLAGWSLGLLVGSNLWESYLRLIGA